MPLTALPHAVLVQIVDLVQYTSPSTLNQLSLVNSLFRSLARYSQHAHITLNLSAGDEGSLVRRIAWIKSADLLSATTEITITDSTRSDDRDHAHGKCVETVCRLLPSLPGLKVVEYVGANIPAQIVTALQSTPHVRLGILPSEHFGLQPDTFTCLHGSPNLHTLGVKLYRADANECIRIMRQLKRVLLSCPSLRCLSMDISSPFTGAHAFGPTQEYVGLGFGNGEKLPPLEELVLIYYPFGHDGRTTGNAAQFNAIGYPSKGTEIDYWVETFDWSRLRRLETGDSDFAIRAAAKLTALKETAHLRSWSKEDIVRFYHEVPSSLTSISVASLDVIGLPGLLRHSATLQVLHIHQMERHEGYGVDWDEGAMDLLSLQQIQEECTLIRDLVIDLAHSEAWPYPEFDVLGAFPRLSNLEIWFAIGIQDPEHPRTPFVTFDSAKHIFEYVRSRHPGNMSPLRKLTLHSGAPPPTGFGFPTPEAFWPEHNSTSFVCELSERDDEAAIGRFAVTCPKLEAYTKLVRPGDKLSSKGKKSHTFALQALRHGRPSFKKGRFPPVEQQHKHLLDEAWLVAHEGPRRMGEWKDLF